MVFQKGSDVFAVAEMALSQQERIYGQKDVPCGNNCISMIRCIVR